MTESATETTAEATTEAPATGAPAEPSTPETPAPPWGSAEEFNPEKAWNLIQNLRGDLTTAKDKVKGFEDAQLSEQEKAARDLAEARESAQGLEIENAKLRAIAEHPGLTIEDFDLIGGSNAEQVKEAAAKLAARLGSGTPTAPPTARPSETLPRGGGDPTVPAESTDWLRDALSKSRS